jgi:subtilisin-like proprotein convertase family protein
MLRPLALSIVVLLAIAAGVFSRPAPVRAQPVTFSNATPITIPGAGKASPYPSTIAVSGLAGVITDVNVTLTGLSHTFPNDVDVLLVGPGRHNVMLLSDVGGGPNINDVSLTFDDAAPAALPNATVVVSGTYRPTNHAGNDGLVESLPAPAPAGPHGTTLSVFSGTDPNGIWRLFVRDDQGGDVGTIAGGWSLTLATGDVTPPVVIVPADLTVEATSAAGAVVTYSASATDDVDGTLTPSCDPSSGSTLPLGATTVTCAATDSAGNSAATSFTVTVKDTTAPDLTAPANLTVAGTNSAGAVVTYSASAIDLVAGALTPTCNPASGSTFPLGTATVTCTATDRADNTSTASFTVTVVDAEAPVLSVPGNLTVEATSAAGAVVTFSATATDDVDGPVPATCDLASSSTVPLGATTVTCTATDSTDNTSAVSFTVTVQDTTAPALTVPADPTVEASGPNGAVVTYSATASDVVDGTLTPSCAPSSGSTFRIGTTSLTCTATDDAGNTGTASFQVVVAAPTISALSPNRVALSGSVQTITIRGANFVAGATVTVGAKTYVATVVSSTELRVSIVPRDVFVAGWLVVPMAKVTVVNPGGAISNSLTLYLAL